MFDLGSGELLVIGIVALIAIGPKELPGLLRTVGQTVARLRRIAGDFQGQFQSALREAELHDAMKSVSDIQSSVSGVTSFNDPLANLQMPSLPEPITTPPVELQPPVTAVPDVAVTPAEKPKASRGKKKSDTDAPSGENPQAALFDAMDHSAQKVADNSAPKTVAAKRTRASKTIGAEPATQDATKSKRKPKIDEASS